MPNVMAAQLNTSGALCKSSIIPLFVPHHKVWLMPNGRLPCSNAANIVECKTWMQSEVCTWQNSVRGQKPPKNVYIVYQARKGLASGERHLCSNKAKTSNPLKFAWVPIPAHQSQPLVCLHTPYCEDMWRRYCCLTSFFPVVDTCLSCEDIA